MSCLLDHRRVEFFVISRNGKFCGRQVHFLCRVERHDNFLSHNCLCGAYGQSRVFVRRNRHAAESFHRGPILYLIERSHDPLVVRILFRDKDTHLDAIEVRGVFLGIESIDFLLFSGLLQLDVCGIINVLSENLFQRFCLLLDLFRADLEKGFVWMDQNRRDAGFRIDERAGLFSGVQSDLRVFDFESNLLDPVGMLEVFLNEEVGSGSEGEKSEARKSENHSIHETGLLYPRYPALHPKELGKAAQMEPRLTHSEAGPCERLTL